MKAQPKQESSPFVILSPCAPFVRGPKAFVRANENVSSASKTIPDDSFTIAELFNRYKSGQPLPNGLERPISFSEDPTHNDLDLGRIRLMDLAEVGDLKKRVSDTLHFLNERKGALELEEKAKNEALAAKKAENNQFPGSPA